MKRVISMLLALCCVFALCACGGDEKTADVGAKDLVAAAQQATGFKEADVLFGADDSTFADRFFYYYGIEFNTVRDCAMAYSSESKAYEISVLVAADGTDIDTLTDALETHRQMQKSAYELYSPESVEMLDNAQIFSMGDYAVLVVADDSAAIADKIRELLTDADSVSSLSQQFYDEAASKSALSDYDYSKPVAESTAKGEDWFRDAAFVGDSRMAGVMLYAKFEYGADFSHVGLTVSDVFTKPYIETDSGTLTVSDALVGGTYGKVYIMTGLNELGWTNYDRFVQCYGDLVDRVKETHPEAQIYVISVLPVGSAATAEKDYLNNARVQMFNDYILKMCSEKNVFYVDGYAAVADSDGNLPDDAAPDGVHMEPKYCRMLTDYLLSHTVEPD